jgi:hypothetical protein
VAVVTGVTVGGCHVGGRRRGSHDCCLGSRERAIDLTEPDDDALPGGNIGDEGDVVNAGLGLDGEGVNCGETGDGCERSITGG